jgi:hypothetical protein
MDGMSPKHLRKYVVQSCRQMGCNTLVMVTQNPGKAIWSWFRADRIPSIQKMVNLKILHVRETDYARKTWVPGKVGSW